MHLWIIAAPKEKHFFSVINSAAIMEHIYSGKNFRRMVKAQEIFDVHGDVEECPAILIASNRTLISRCNVVEVDDTLSDTGHLMTLFLFNDLLMLCRKKSNSFIFGNNSNSQNGHNSMKKSHKLIRMITLNSVKRIVDVQEEKGL